jgi:hypothetical protein
MLDRITIDTRVTLILTLSVSFVRKVTLLTQRSLSQARIMDLEEKLHKVH